MNPKSVLRTLLDLPARCANGRWLRSLRRDTSVAPVISFGRVLEDREFIHGGAVKLLHLRNAFTANEACFNVLYLVSSAQPQFALDLARACKARGIAFVWNQNGVGYPGWAGPEAERHNAPMRRLRGMADFVVYQSAFCRASAERFLGTNTKPSEVLFNPVDLDFFRPEEKASAPRPLRLLAMGTQNYRERVYSTLDCLKVLRDGGVEAELTIAGTLQWPNARAELARYSERLELAKFLIVHPAFSQAEAANLYREHDILLHPKYLDPCPTVVIEALASGLPVIGSASGGLPEMVPADCGELIPAPLDWNKLITPSGEQLAAAVQKLLPRLADASRTARRHAEVAFGHARWIARHDEIFRSLVS